MSRPERPTCHDKDYRASTFPESIKTWRDADTESTNEKGNQNRFYRTCGFCGSIHPEDLVKAMLAEEIRSSERADMKYGYPHKIYLQILSPWRGEKCVRGRKNFGPEEDRVMWGTISDYDQVKFYTTHLYDDGFSEETLGQALQALRTNSCNVANILREIDDEGKVKFQFKFKSFEMPEATKEAIRRINPDADV